VRFWQETTKRLGGIEWILDEFCIHFQFLQPGVDKLRRISAGREGLGRLNELNKNFKDWDFFGRVLGDREIDSLLEGVFFPRFWGSCTCMCGA